MSQRFGKYELVRLLATGGMGEVFLARLTGPGGYQKQLVIKRLLRHLALRQDFVDLFWNEARLAAMLTHPNIVQLYELGEVEGEHFIAMEYVPGITAGHLLRHSAALPPALAAHICAQALRGLQYAHQRADDSGAPLGIIHRDVSADNLLLSVDGAVKLSDFGIAKATALSDTTHGVVKGKFAYMSPEQLRAEKLDARSDVYGMGVVLYQLLAGRLPIEGASDSQLIQRVLSVEPSPLPDGVPRPLAQLALRALAKEAEGRFGSAREMADALDAWLRTQEHSSLEQALSERVRALQGPEVAEASGLAARTAASTHAAASVGRTHRPRWPLAVGVGAAVVAAVLGARHFAGRAPPPDDVLSAVVAPAPGVSPKAEPVAVPAAAPPPPKTSRPRAAGKGTLVLRVYPWAEVFVDGRSLGVTPMAPVSLEAGRRVVVLKNPELNQEKRYPVRVPAGGTVVLEADLLKRR